MTLDEKKTAAAAWFRTLRDQICAEFEAIEMEYAAKLPVDDIGMRSVSEPLAAGVSPKGVGGKEPSSIIDFIRTAWTRPDGGSGEMSLMKGHVFEKVGVNISVVEGEFSEQFRAEIPGASENPKFWAAGISLVAHMASPLVPAAHMNTRMIVVGDRVAEGAPRSGRGQRSEGGASNPSINFGDQHARLWFGGGGDLNPMVENPTDTAAFHAAFKESCDKTNPEFYPAFKAWCDEYFFIPHRNESRGVGGIFYDYLGLNTFGADTAPVTSGRFGKDGVTAAATAHGMQLAANANLDWAQGFEFTKNVGRTFASIYPELIRRHMFEPWTDDQRHQQLVKRGRYAEYNLLYDRGTRFGLMTGGNAEAILMSLPPLAIWE